MALCMRILLSVLLLLVAVPTLSTRFVSSAHSQSIVDGEATMQQEIARLIEQLADRNYHRRVNAKWELERIGLAAFEQLRQAAHAHPDAHISRAARYLIDSQNVVWWLETDSVEVRELLKDYNDSKEIDRDTLLQQLAEHASDDALLALGRLARFESSELRSKSAALYLMEAVAKRAARSDDEDSHLLDAALPKSIGLTLGESRRSATRWLKALMDDLARTGQPSDLERWKRLIAEEHALASAEMSSAKREFDGRQSLALVLRMYRWLGSWITQTHDRAAALELVRPSIRLIGDNALAVRTAASWALEAELPELLPELAEEYPAVFSVEPELGFYLAEGYLRLGDEKSAEAAAEEASQSVVKQLESSLKKWPSLDLDEMVANRHYQLAKELERRGLNEWAEKEYLLALELEAREEARIRSDLAQFYWFGAEHAKAAEALRPLAEEILTRVDVDLPRAPNDFTNPTATLATYYFYLGLAAIDRMDFSAASDHLRRALESDPALPNPDVVIAMKVIAVEEPFLSYYQEQFQKMCDDFRVRVLNAEEEMSRATDRNQRASAAPRLSTECNQLAWLLSKCEVHPREALNLSHRSLELMPDDPMYLDTLARCYFAAGQVEEAVRVQRRAVRLAPYERQMIKQLKEFEEALVEQESERADQD